ncbi:hypothetical protein CEUSTIGMA_g101.t1 [Chlamydomonas eustigma]|uniref:Sec-independent protein translocase protein TATB, chloroplastic n=1 Tax=Chlamydomonas eustigma TaxID=1157962 RepID=A0A250WP87_9CHLO|nr:hypothetical protein CEUSTIGMA_g101.t1 [Chlamydomonas eustigma]|eukprot:GAX72645.1 hypothetical protein CEUSTIGMA_g101.t1 [Chlamydomonas eustigma]
MTFIRSSRACQPLCTSLTLTPTQQRVVKKSTVHMAYSTPAQFSSFYGCKMVLPECYVRRGMQMIKTALRKPAQMSFLGVGAPEAILVGIVALIVFGPKGLAEAAKSVGQTLRSFQPTIKEVVEVGQELKGSLEKELGLDELRQAARPLPKVPEPLPFRDKDVAQTMDPDIETKRAEAAKLAWGGQQLPSSFPSTLSVPSTNEPNATASSLSDAASSTASTSAKNASPAPKDLSAMSVDELEAELARRKAGQ